jgi:predicted nucleic acid-binding Zn ribbon protein
MSRRGKRRKGQPTAIGDIVGQVLGDLGLDAVARAQRIGAIWESAVGAPVAAHCRPLGMRGDVLELEVDSPVWSQQLQLRKPELLAALERVLGSGAPRELHFQVGYANARKLAVGRGIDPEDRSG